MVLLVEDEPLVRELVEGMLRRGGYEVLGVASGEEALAAAPSIAARLTLVLADMSLPGINGKETVRRLQATIPNLKAIHMSGNPGDRANEQELFVSKPFSRAQLLGAVAGVIGTPAK